MIATAERKAVKWSFSPPGDPPRHFSVSIVGDKGFMPLSDLAALMAIDVEELRPLASLQPDLGEGDFIELHPAEAQLASLCGIDRNGRTGLVLKPEPRHHRYLVCLWLLRLAVDVQALQNLLQTLLTLGQPKGLPR